MNINNLFRKALVFSGFILLVFLSNMNAKINANNDESKPKNPDQMLMAQNKAGKYLSKNKMFEFELSISSMGGFLSLSAGSVNEKPQIKVDDVNGVIWISENAIIYSVSPIYGHPGIYLFDYQAGATKILVKPETINQAYPDGADYFELRGFSKTKKEMSFYYFNNVDKANFKNFRNKNNLRHFRVDQYVQ